MNTTLLLKRKFCKPFDNKGFSSIIGALFMILIVGILASAYFVSTLSQNAAYDLEVKAQTQLDLDRQNEFVNAVNVNYTISSENVVALNVTLQNAGSLGVELKTLWVIDDYLHKYGHLENLAVNLPAGNTVESVFFSLNIGAASNDSAAFSGWFITARGNIVPLQQFSVNDGAGDYYYSSFLNVSGLTKIMGDFIPDYHSVQWAEVNEDTNVVGSWNDGWVVPSADSFNLAWRINMTYYGTTLITIDENTMLFFNPFSGQNPGGKAPPLCYIVDYDLSTRVISSYYGNEIVVQSPAGDSGTNVTFTFGSSDYPRGTGGILNKVLPGNLMSLTIYGKAPSNYAQSFPLFAVSTRDPVITLDQSSCTVGTPVTVIGSGFNLNSHITVSFESNNNYVIQYTYPSPVTTTSGGSFIATFTIPSSYGGIHSVKAIDAGSKYATVSLTITPLITLSPSFGLSGIPVAVSGTGFAKSSTISLLFDSSQLSTTPNPIVSNVNGSFTATFNVPSSTAGVHTLTAQDTYGYSGFAPFTLASNLVTISSNPSGSGFVIVDGVNVATPTTIYTWANGSVHNLQVLSPVSGPTGTQYVWQEWSDGVTNQTRSYTVHSSSDTITAIYTTQYYLTVNAQGYGSCGGQGWYNANTNVSFSISPTIISGSGSQIVFTGWTGTGTGAYGGTLSSSQVNMTNPITETANWVTQYQVPAQYSVADSSNPPVDAVLTGVQAGQPFFLNLTNTVQTPWLDSGTTWSVGNSIAGAASERWFAGSGTSGAVSAYSTINPLFYHQYQVPAKYSTSDNSNAAAHVVLVGMQGSMPFSQNLTRSNQQVWLDTGAEWSMNSSVPESATTERWAASSGTSGTVNLSTNINPTYNHQFSITFAVNPSDSGTTNPSSVAEWYNNGSQSIVATPNTGYKFTSWSSSNTSITFASQNASTTANINGSGTITTNFVPDQLSFDGFTSQSTATNSITLNLVTTHQNDLLYLSVACGTQTVTSISSTPSLTWTQRASISTNGRVETWYAINPSNGSIAIAVTLSGSTAASSMVFAISGANTTAPFDSVNAVTGSGGSGPASVSITTSNNNCIIIGAVQVNGIPSLSAGTGYTLIATQLAGTTRELSNEYKIVSSKQTNLPVNFPYSGNQNWSIIADAIKQAQ